VRFFGPFDFHGDFKIFSRLQFLRFFDFWGSFKILELFHITKILLVVDTFFGCLEVLGFSEVFSTFRLFQVFRSLEIFGDFLSSWKFSGFPEILIAGKAGWCPGNLYTLKISAI
jgi:hypothetical protein